MQNPKQYNYSYVNLIINNTGVRYSIQGEYNQTLNNPILALQEDFETCIVRLKCPYQTIPSMIFKNDYYYISLAINIDNIALAVPITVQLDFNPTTTTNVEFPYSQGIYYYTQLIEMLNRALETAWALARITPPFSAFIGNATNYTIDDFPYFRLNPETLLFELVLPIVVSDEAPSVWGDIAIWMNAPLFYLFSGFDAKHYFPPLDTPDDKLAFRLITDVRPEDLQTLPELYLPIRTVGVIKQNFPSLKKFQQIARIIVTTSMPILGETIVVNDTSGEATKLSVLTDFEIRASDNILNDNIDYDAGQASFRWQTLIAMGDLNDLSAQIFLQFNDLTLIPLKIFNGQEFSMKLAFRRKKNPELLQNSDIRSLASRTD